MDYFFEFHWWYVPVGIVLVFMMFGKGKGGFVVKRLTADMEVLDDRFADCRFEADYATFKEGEPDHIEIELERLSIPVGDELEFLINGELLAVVAVERDKEAEFDHWADEDVEFPVIQEGDQLVIKYQGLEVAKGTFSL